MNKLKVFADFHNADTQGRVRLNCIGTIEDLARQQIVLRDGVRLTLYSEELEWKASSNIPQTNICGWPSLTGTRSTTLGLKPLDRRLNATAKPYCWTLRCRVRRVP